MTATTTWEATPAVSLYLGTRDGISLTEIRVRGNVTHLEAIDMLAWALAHEIGDYRDHLEGADQ